MLIATNKPVPRSPSVSSIRVFTAPIECCEQQLSPMPCHITTGCTGCNKQAAIPSGELDRVPGSSKPWCGCQLHRLGTPTNRLVPLGAARILLLLPWLSAPQFSSSSEITAAVRKMYVICAMLGTLALRTVVSAKPSVSNIPLSSPHLMDMLLRIPALKQFWLQDDASVVFPAAGCSSIASAAAMHANRVHEQQPVV